MRRRPATAMAHLRPSLLRPRVFICGQDRLFGRPRLGSAVRPARTDRAGPGEPYARLDRGDLPGLRGVWLAGSFRIRA